MECNLDCEDCLKELCMYKAPLFASLEYDQLKHIAGQMVCCAYEKGERLLSQGEIPRAFTVILQGRVKAVSVWADGREKILAILSKNDYFGEQYLFGSHPADYSMEALTKVSACSFSRESFRALLVEFPQIAVRLIEGLGERIVRLESVAKTAAGSRVDARIAALLLEYAQKYAVQTESGPQILLPLSREGMANYLGIARETMSRKLKKMEADGLIAGNGNKHIVLLKPGLLEKLARGG